MKNQTGILLKTVVILLLIMSLGGCWNRRELDTLGIVMGIGVDKSVNSGEVQVTAQVVKPEEIKAQNKTGGGGTQAFWNVSSTGDTVFATLRDITNKSSRKLFFPHNQVLIFGRSIAEDGIQKHIDFFVRDPETRMNVWVLIAEDTALEILEAKCELEKVPANNIAKLVEGQAAATSQTPAIKLRELVVGLMNKSTASTVPLIKIAEDDREKLAMVSETAVFKGDELVGRMDKVEGRGLMWVLGRVKSSIIEVKGPGNDKVSLETIRASSKIIPKIKNKKLTMRVIIQEEGNIGEQTGPENLSKLTQVAALEKKKAEVITSEVKAAVKKAQELDADVFGFGDTVHKKYPGQWGNLEKNWDEIFKTLQVEVDVEAKLRLMGRVSKPSVPE